jgi:hypothetical protein
MKLSTLFHLMTSGQTSLMFQLFKMSNEFYRACFISTAVSEGIFDAFTEGRSSFEALRDKLNIGLNQEGLLAWLELGVSLGELKRNKDEFQIKGRFSKVLIDPTNTSVCARRL